MKLRILNLVVLVFFVMVLLSSSPVLAQTQTYDGLDIVFLIDQSDSMSRNFGGEANDPLGLRFYGLSYAMYWLGEDHLLIHSDTTVRMSVINFGEVAVPVNFNDGSSSSSYWKEIAPRSRDEWDTMYQEMSAILDTSRTEYTNRGLGTTHFLGAFEAAEELFAALPPTSENRLRVIILLTDGLPYYGPGGFNYESYMETLADFSAANFPYPDYRIYVVGMLDSGQSYWTKVRPYWEEITQDPCLEASCPEPDKDRASIVASNDDVGKRFQEILQGLTSEFALPSDVQYVDEAVIPGPLVVPPYLRSITFSYFKTDTSQRLVISDPNGEIDETDAGVTVDGVSGPIQSIRVSNPMPGEWQVATDPLGVNVDITMRYIFAQSRLTSPSGPQSQFIPLTINYSLLDDFGQPLPVYSDSRYKLKVTATVEADGTSQQLVLNNMPDNSYQADFTPVLAVNHTIRVKAESQDQSGNQIVILDGIIGSFDVKPSVLVPLDLPVEWQQYKEQPLTFELQDARGFPITSPSSLDLAVTIQEDVSNKLILTPTSDGKYSTTYAPQKSGMHVLHVAATVLDVSGIRQTIIDEDIASFDVLPATLVEIAVLQPGPDPQFNTGLWPLTRNPLVLELQFQDNNGRELSPQDLFEDDAVDVFSVTDVKNQDDEKISIPLQFDYYPETNSYRARTTDLGIGEYIIAISADEPLNEYVYPPNGSSLIIKTVRVRYPLHTALMYIGMVLMVLVIGVGSAYKIRSIQNQKHPCRGKLYIVDADGSRKFQSGSLEEYNRNRIVFKDINSVTHVSKLEVICSSDAEHQQRHVSVNIWLDNERTPSIAQYPLRPGSEVKIGRYSFWLMKDPDEDQLIQERYGDVEEDTSF